MGNNKSICLQKDASHVLRDYAAKNYHLGLTELITMLKKPDRNSRVPLTAKMILNLFEEAEILN